MSSKLIESHREKAVVHTGLGVCKEKARELFVKLGLPNAILYLEDVVEFGYNESTGFMWLKRPKKTEQVHHKLGNKGSFDVEVTLFIAEHSIKSLKGFKVKEMLMWIPVSGIQVDVPNTKLTISTVAGITRSMPFDNFVLED